MANVAPVQTTNRVDSIDVLRGLAVLGIFVMNIPTFALLQATFYSPPIDGGFTGIDYAVWLGSHLFFEFKMMAIFSMLFGAGILLLTQKTEAQGGSRAALHYRRCAILLAIGMLHAYLIWFGDILVPYALIGMLVYLLRKLKPRTLIIIASVVMFIPPALGLLNQLGMEMVRSAAEDNKEWAVDRWAEMSQGFIVTEASAAEESAGMLGTFWERVEYAAPITVWIQTLGIPFWFLWRVGGLMLLGMALFKTDVLTAGRSASFYLRMILLGFGIGLPMTALGVWMMHNSDFDPVAAQGINAIPNYFGSLATALGWIGLVMLICKLGALTAVRTGLRAVGRMAFTNYLTQSLVAAFIFYGWGLGYWGQIDRAGLMLIVIGVWAMQIAWSLWWLKRFRMGPLEWLWRWGSYGKRPALRVARPAHAEAGS